MQYLGNTSRGVCRDLSVLPNILNGARFLQSFPTKLWYHSDVLLPWGGRLWERGWPDTMRSTAAGSGGGMMFTPCFWMFPPLCRMFCWEMLAKGTWRSLQEAQGGMVREEGCRERKDAGRGTVVWAGEQELLPKQGLRHCTHTPGRGNSSLSYHPVLCRACKKHTWRHTEQFLFSEAAAPRPETSF